jgi:hypothetical protein
MCRSNLFSNLSRTWAAAAALAVVLMQSQDCTAYESYCGGEPYNMSEPYCASYPPPLARSALDVPLNWYFMPRRPGCARHEFRYQVEMPEPCPARLDGCGRDAGEPCCTDGLAVAPELMDGFVPLEFERLGQIPNDSMLEAAAGGQ